MRRLDEVIKAVEFCMRNNDNCPSECPFVSSCSPTSYAMKADALHYLTEYRDRAKDLDNMRLMYLNAMANWEVNPSLSWEELRDMTGEPVWIEWTGTPRWGIVDGIFDDAFGVTNLCVAVPHDYLHFDKRMQGQTWDAFRKVRE